MGLKPGRVSNFENSMAAAIEDMFREEWLAVNNAPLPDAGQKDRRLLFVAVARGILTYLAAHQKEAVRQVTLKDPATNVKTSYAVTALTLDIEL